MAKNHNCEVQAVPCFYVRGCEFLNASKNTDIPTLYESLQQTVLSTRLLSDHLGWGGGMDSALPGTDGVFALTDGH